MPFLPFPSRKQDTTDLTRRMPRYGGGGGGGGAAAGGSGKSSSTKVFQTMEQAIMSDGVTFDVRYIGCLEIKSSMKTLEFATRSHVAK